MTKQSFKERRREEILDRATELLTTRPTATQKDIAAYCNIGIATFHRYFDGREDLMLELALRSVKLVQQALKDIKIDSHSFRSSLIQIVEKLIPLGHRIYFLSRESSLYKNTHLYMEVCALYKPIVEMLSIGKNTGTLRKDIDETWATNALHSILFCAWSEIQNGSIARNDAPTLVADTLLYGLIEVNTERIST